MLYKQISVGTNHSCLSCHLHELSYELNNMRKRPAVLVLPGGGYHICAGREAEPVALAYMAQGFQACSNFSFPWKKARQTWLAFC